MKFRKINIIEWTLEGIYVIVNCDVYQWNAVTQARVWFQSYIIFNFLPKKCLKPSGKVIIAPIS